MSKGEGSDAAQLAGGSGVLFGSQLVDRVARLVTTWILPFFLGDSAYGVYAAANEASVLASEVAQVGTPSGALYFGARAHATGDRARLKGVLYTGALITLIAGTLGMLVTLALAMWGTAWLSEPDVAWAVAVAAPIALFRPLQRVAVANLNAVKDMRGMARAQFITLPLSMLVASAAALALGLGVAGALVALCASYVLSLADALWRSRRWFSDVVRSRLPSEWMARRMLMYSVPISLADMLYRLNLRLDILMLVALATTADVGQYRVAVTLAMLGSLPATAVRMGIKPMVAELVKLGEQARLDDLLETATRWLVVLAAPLYVVLLLVPDGLLSLYGEDYLAGTAALVALVLGQVVNITCAPVSTVLQMSGHPRLEFANGVGALLANVGLNLWLIPLYGPLGAAMANAVALTTWSAARTVEVRILLGCFPFSARVFGVLGYTIATTGAAMLLLADASLGLRALLVGGICVGGLVWVGLFVVTPEDHETWGFVRERLRSRLGR